MALGDWTNLSSINKQLTPCFGAAYDNKLFFVDTSTSVVTNIYDINTNTWSTGEAHPNTAFAGRSYGTLDAQTGTIFITGFDTTQARFYSYEIATNTWTTLTVPTIPCSGNGVGPFMASTPGYVWALGGSNAAGTTALKEVQRYNIALGTWATVNTSCPVWYLSTDAHSHAFVIGDSIYMFFGWEDAANGSWPAGSSQVATIRIYNTETDSWSVDSRTASGSVDSAGVGHITKTDGTEIAYKLHGASATDFDEISVLAASAWTENANPPWEGGSPGCLAWSGNLYGIDLVSGTQTDLWRYEAFPAGDVVNPGIPVFEGTDGATIYPAPEKLPHVITRRDTLDNLPLQRKLQENFDSIERQLLALDPDNDPEGRNNPYR